MVHYLVGNSDLGKELYVREYVRRTGAQYTKVFADDEGKIEELKNAAVSVGLFAACRVFDLVDFDQWSKKDREAFANIEFAGKSVEVFVRTESAPKNLKTENAEVLVFATPKEWEEEKWLGWIKQLGRSLEVDVPTNVAQLMLRYVGTNEYALYNELRKLVTYAVGGLDKLTDEEIQSLLFKRTVTRLDEFCFAVSEADKKTFTKTIGEVCHEYEEPLVVHSLAKHFIDLLHVALKVPKKPSYSWPEISDHAKRLGMPTPKVARFLGFKFKGQDYRPINHALLYTPELVASLIDQLYKIDRLVKVGGDVRILLHQFFGEVAKKTSIGEEVRT